MVGLIFPWINQGGFTAYFGMLSAGLSVEELHLFSKEMDDKGLQKKWMIKGLINHNQGIIT